MSIPEGVSSMFSMTENLRWFRVEGAGKHLRIKTVAQNPAYCHLT